MARQTKITHPDGTTTTSVGSHRPGWPLWAVYAFLIFAAIGYGQWQVRLVGIAFAVLSLVGLWMRRTHTK